MAHHHDETPEVVLKAFGDITDRELAEQIGALANLYQQTFRGLTAAATQARNAMLAAGRIETLDLRSFQELMAQTISRNLQNSLVDVSDDLADEVIREGLRAVERLPETISFQMAFDRTDPRAITWARTRAGSLIQQIQDETLATVRGIVAGALSEGGGVIGAANQIERVIGLHPRWQQAVENRYEAEIARLTAADPERALEAIQGDAQQVADAYRNQLTEVRALTIARTEILAAQNIGQLVSWLQAADNGYLDLNNALKEWVAGPDGWAGISICEVCLELAGQQVPVLSVFSNGEATPPAHPNCRCSMNLIVVV